MPTGMIENDAVHFQVSENGWHLEDKRAGVTWRSASMEGRSWLALAGKPYDSALFLSAVAVDEAGSRMKCRFADGDGYQAPVSLTFRLIKDAVHVFAEPGLDEAFPALRLAGPQVSEGGEALLPIRMGLLLPAEGDPFEMNLGTYEYEGLHMALVGMMQPDGALMASWSDPYTRAQFARTEDVRLQLSFTLQRSARSLELRALGEGGLPALAKAALKRAESLGFRVTLAEKFAELPDRERLVGTCNFKLWQALARRVNEDLEEVSVDVVWRFDEIAEIAEHLKQKLELKDVLFHVGGWTRYGYDCRHPDNMPANPECGGNEGLIALAERVRACGYLFCLHDNYQDMYRDAPSWNESCLQREPDGTPHKGGVWLGGRAYYTCAREALKLALRPENLPLIHDTFDPDLYFIDTTYAVGPQECADPRHPLTKQDDIRWKIALSDRTRDLFGMFGSECGREWAVPHADFFEGLASVRGDYFHQLNPRPLNGRVVPFFDMVFRDCIIIHGKYGGYDPAEMAEQVIHHVAMGRPLYYHFGLNSDHVYGKDAPVTDELPLVEGPDHAAFTRAHDGWAEGMNLWDRFMKNTHEVLGPLHALTAHSLIENYDFLDDERLIRRTTFVQNGEVQAVATVNGSESVHIAESEQWGEVALPPYGFLVEAPAFVAFHALSFNGGSYERPVLFTLTALDGVSLIESEEVRVYHGFGDPALVWRGGEVNVKREQTLSRSSK